MNRTPPPLSVVLPLAAFLVVLAMSVSSWYLIERFEEETVRLKTRLTAEQVGIRLDEYLHTRLAVVRQLSKLWERGRVPQEAQFARHAAGLMVDFPGLLAINWVDPEGYIRWITPEEPNLKARDRDLKTHPGAADTFLQVMASGESRVTPPITLYQGGRGMAAYMPILADGASCGYLNAVFRLTPMVEHCLAKGVHDNFDFVVLDGETLIHASGEVKEILGDPRRAPASFPVGQRTWTVFLAPRPALVANTSTFINEVALAVSLILGFVLAVFLRRFLLSREALRRTEDRYRQLVELMSEGMVYMDARERISYANPQFEAMLGYDPGELVGRRVETLFDEDNAAEVRRRIAERRSGLNTSYEIVWQHRDGHGVPTLVSPNRMGGRGGRFRGSLAVISDLTSTKAAEAEKEQLEEQLRQSQKLEAIGRLAGGVAHDFNNILTGVTGFSSILLMETEPDSPLAGYVQQISKAAERGAMLTRQLLAFSRRQVIEPRVLDLRSLFADAEAMLRRVLGEDVSVSFHAAPDLWDIVADPSQVDQILLNLVVNARDAVGEGGWIRVSAGNAYRRRPPASEDATRGECVIVEVADNGCGMDAETQERIFEPFFTTKEAGKGTGLGLATVYGVVKQNGGDVEVDSRPGRGTNFRVILPRAAGRAEATAAAEPSEAGGGNETILLVEDDDVVREPIRRVLQESGYTVLAAASGDEALDIAASRDGGIDLLLTDVIMPGMDGKELAERLAEQRGDVVVLFMSGHVADVLADHGVLQEGVRLIEKPFSLDALATKVREVLDERLRARAQ